MEFEELQSYITRRSDSPLFAKVASILLEQEDAAGAKDLCLIGVEQYPNYSTGLLMLAKCQYADFQLEEAIETVKRARKIFPDSVQLISLQREWEDMVVGVPPAAAPEPAVQTKGVESIPGEGEIVSQTLAEIYVQQGLLDQAIASYEKLKERKPEQAAEFTKRIEELKKKLSSK